MKSVFESVNSVSRTDFDKNHALNRIRQLNETVSILHSTTNVSTFFSRLDFAFEICDDLAKYKHTGVMQRITPEQQKQELLELLPNHIDSLITRSRDNAYNKAKELKTANGKYNRMVKFYTKLISDLNQYGSKYITVANIEKIKTLATKDKVSADIDLMQLKPVKLELPTMSFTPVSSATTTHNTNLIKKTPQPSYNNTYQETSNNSGCLALAIVGVPILIIIMLLWNVFKL